MAKPPVPSRVRDTTTKSGSAAVVTLDNAPPAAHRAFLTIALNVEVPVVMAHRTLNEWQEGYARRTAASTIEFTRVTDNHLGTTAAVNFSAGVKDIFIDDHGSYHADVPSIADGLDVSALPVFTLTAGDQVLAYRPSNGSLGLLLSSALGGTGGGTAPVDNPPTLSAASATVTGPTAATGSVTTNETGGTLYWLFSTSATATAAAVKAGSSKAVTALGAQSVSSSTLTASTQYYLHFLHRDTLPQDSPVLTVGPFTTQAAGTPAPTVTGVTITPSTANVAGGGTQQFTGTVAGANSPSQGINWTCSPAGTINASGLFTGPAATGSAQTITITGTAQQDGTTFGTATVTIAAAVAAAPTLTKAGAIRATGAATGLAAATTDQPSGDLYRLVSANATETGATVKAANVKQAVTATGAQPISLAGIAGTTLYLHLLHSTAGGDSAVVSTPLYQYAPFNGSTRTKEIVLPSTGTLNATLAKRYYTGSDAWDGTYYTVSPQYPNNSTIYGGWGDSPTVPPPLYKTGAENTASGGGNNGMIPLTVGTGTAWNMTNPLLWQADGVQSPPRYYWLQVGDAPPVCISFKDGGGNFVATVVQAAG